MRLTAMSAVTIAAGMTVQAGETKRPQVTVYVRNSANVSGDVKAQAENQASAMFASIGVKIDWRCGEPRSTSEQALVIELARNTPQNEKPGALAYAKPYEGVHIVVFWDRMEFGLAPSSLLAHVMVHEITHILEGVSRHSESGIMKAHWEGDDYSHMDTKPLAFTRADIDLIYRGLDARASHLAPSTLAAANSAPEMVAAR